MLNILKTRANGACELCQSEQSLSPYAVPESPDQTANSAVLLCETCFQQIDANKALDAKHFTCLNQSMWSSTPAVQVLSYRLLHKLNAEAWAQDALDMLYLEDDVKAWADRGLLNTEATLDVNGLELNAGDSVTIVKDLDVKGANFTAKRGTPVRNISLSDNPLHIEGKVNGQRIVIIAAYTKKN